MALDSSDSPEHKQAVFKAMESLPQSYVSFNAHGGQVMVQGMPAHAFLDSHHAVLSRAAAMGVQVALFWNTSGKWTDEMPCA